MKNVVLLRVLMVCPCEYDLLETEDRVCAELVFGKSLF